MLSKDEISNLIEKIKLNDNSIGNDLDLSSLLYFIFFKKMFLNFNIFLKFEDQDLNIKKFNKLFKILEKNTKIRNLYLNSNSLLFF